MKFYQSYLKSCWYFTFIRMLMMVKSMLWHGHILILNLLLLEGIVEWKYGIWIWVCVLCSSYIFMVIFQFTTPPPPLLSRLFFIGMSAFLFKTLLNDWKNFLCNAYITRTKFRHVFHGLQKLGGGMAKFLSVLLNFCHCFSFYYPSDTCH